MRLALPTLVALFSPIVFATPDAQVFFLPANPTAHHQPPALNPTEANTLISHHLGFDIYESLGDRVEGWWNELSSLVYGGKGASHAGVGKGSEDSVLIVIQSDHPEDFIPSEMKQSFTIPNPPPASMFTDLIHAYTERAHHLFDSVLSSLSPAIDSIKTSSTYKGLLDVFDLASEATGMFVEEFGRLVQMIDEDKSAKDVAEDTFSAFEMTGLSKVEKEHGRGSEQYLTAAKSMQAVLSNPALQNRKVAIIVVSPETTLPSLKKRTSPSDLVKPLSTSSNKVAFSVSTCFKTNDTCSQKTNACSGHGSCNPVTIAGKTCFTCSCAITKNDKGRRQWWAGQSCERLDVSTPFVLLAGTAIFLVVIVIFSVSLLGSIGAEPLPNTLAAGAVAHAKRD